MRPTGGPSTSSPFKGNKGKQVAETKSNKPFAIRPSLNSHNQYSALASLPPINPNFGLTPFPPLPSSTSSSNLLVMKKPFSREAEPCSQSPSGMPRYSSPQTKDSYTMKAPQSFKEAVTPITATPKKQAIKENFEVVSLQVIPILALDKEYENYEVKHLVKPLYTNRNYIETDSSIKTRKYYEFILVDTGSIEIEHKLSNDADPDSIAYSKFTIKKILTPFEWQVDHLHTPINLSREHRPQTYNWHDYKAAWFNFLFLRPTTHTWFVKYSLEISKSIIPRWFYEWWNYFGGNKTVLPKSFLDKFDQFQIDNDISSLPEHIKLCKYFIQKRISYIISWTFTISEFDRIKYLSKEVLIKGWSPAPKTQSPTAQVVSKKSPEKSTSKSDLKKRLQKALSEIESDPDEEEIMKLLDEASSSQSDDNGDMLKPRALAQSYLDPFYN